MKKLLALTAIVTLLPATVAAQDFKAFRGNISDSYNYWFYDPQTEPDPNAHFPLLIFLHGRSLCGNDLNKVKQYGPINAIAMGKVIDSYILAPQNPGGSWKPEKIWKIVEWAKEHYHVDETRIYVYGMSLGGYGTLDLAAAYPDQIAAAMAMCGGSWAKDLTVLNRLPLWIVHGTADEKVNVNRSDRVVEAIRATGDDSRLIYSRLPGVNHGRLARLFYMMMPLDWLFSHSTKDPGREVNRSFTLTNEMMDDAYRDIKKTTPEIEPD